MLGLVGVVNKLQDVFSAIGQSPIDLPQIVVVGAQSSGKSSVIESIVGREFLPRGTGIVTRRPLVIQLYSTRKNGGAGGAGRGASGAGSPAGSPSAASPVIAGGAGGAAASVSSTPPSLGSGGSPGGTPAPPAAATPGQEWGEFLHLPGKKFFDFDQIRTEIIRETDRLTGKNKGISNKSINLKIYSPHVLTLSLVDLPGITKVPVGDQPSDIEHLVRSMCMKYVTKPETIVLAVTAANTDLANSDALQMAREVDPEGNRTIGVLTKLDLMDPGTDAMDMLNGRVIPLRLGYVGIVNRSQADIQKRVSIRDAVRKEAAFFQNHASYRSLASRMGSGFLSKMLNQILMQHIRDCLPDLKSSITNMLIELDNELQSLGTPYAATDKAGKSEQLLHLIARFSTNFNNAIEGRSTNKSHHEMNELYGGARISYIFNDVFSRSVSNVDPFEGLSDADIRTAIRNATGTRASLFVPEVSFELLVKTQIKRLEAPAQQCVDLVYDELQRVASQCETSDIKRFEQLRDSIIDVVNQLLRERLVPTQRMISDLVRIELAHINTSHPDFIGGSRAVSQLMERMHEESVKKGKAGGSASRNNDRAAAAGVRSSSGGSSGGSGSGGGKSDAGFLSRVWGGGETAVSTGGPPGMVTLPQMPSSLRQSDEMTERERIEVEIIKSLIRSYYNIVRKNIADLVPKTVMYFLVNHTKQHVQSVLVQRLYRDSSLDDLLRETSDAAQRRKNCIEVQTLLRRALEIVNEVRDYNALVDNGF
jgi:dynamin 1-like protein